MVASSFLELLELSRGFLTLHIVNFFSNPRGNIKMQIHKSGSIY